MDSDKIGLQACWYGGSLPSDIGPTGKPIPHPSHADESPDLPAAGMQLWYATNATTFNQYDWRPDTRAWEFQREWNDKNGHAGIECYTQDSEETSYIMLVNLDDIVEIWWRDTSGNAVWTNCKPFFFCSTEHSQF
jgi:hypothetical protein